MKLAMLTLADGSSRIVWLIHHAVDDVVSMRILVPDLIDVYTQLVQGSQPVLPAKTTSYPE